MRSIVSRSLLWAASVAGVIAIIATGCASPRTAAKAAKPPISARQAIALSARDAAGWRSDVSTTTVIGIDDGVQISSAETLREESGPFNELSMTSEKRDGKDVLVGGSDSIVTPTVYYLRAAQLSRYFHTAKPWVELSQAMALALSAQTREPVPAPPVTFYGDPSFGIGLLTISTDVRAVGTGSVNGVPATEYEGAYSAASGLAYEAPTSASAVVAEDLKEVVAMGLATVRFRVWLGPQQRPLKLVLIEAGTHANLTMTQTIVSFNQPANIQFPIASETYVVPGTSKA